MRQTGADADGHALASMKPGSIKRAVQLAACARVQLTIFLKLSIVAGNADHPRTQNVTSIGSEVSECGFHQGQPARLLFDGRFVRRLS